jgi:ADP-heptose:LPS heptosyltransferase
LDPIKKVLVIRFSSIGDIVLTTPVARCLKKQTGAEVHFLTKSSFKSVVASNPYIDKVYTIDKEVREVLPGLKREGYDAIVDLHHNLRSWQVKRALSPAPAYSFDKLNWEKWLMVRFKINRLPNIHIVDRYLAAAGPLGVTNDGQGLDYFIPPADEVDAPALLAQILGERGIALVTPFEYIAFVIGAAHATKRLPPAKITAACKQMAPRIVVLLGGPEDSSTGAEIARNAGGHVVDLCGKMKLNQSASLVRQAARVITHDTGLMHIAAAFQKEIISVWGNTIPEFGMYPYYPAGKQRNKSVEVNSLSCRPCSKIGFQACPRGHFNCMEQIDLGELG